MGSSTTSPTGPVQPMGYRQGTITAWNPTTLENVIESGGATLTNVPVLGVAEAASLAEGSVVGLMVVGETWAILGRLVIPGSSEAQDAITQVGQRRLTATVLTAENRTLLSFDDLTTPGPTIHDMRTPASGKVQVTVSAQISGAGSVGVAITGADTRSPNTHQSLIIVPNTAGLNASRVLLVEDLTPGGLCTYTLKYQGDGVDVTAFSDRDIIVEAL